MDNVTIPHFDYPFRFGTNSRPVVVQQNSDKDVLNCVTAIVKTERGTRLYVSDFGIDDPTFELQPIDTNAILAQVRLNEPRANVLADQQILDTLEGSVTISVG